MSEQETDLRDALLECFKGDGSPSVVWAGEDARRMLRGLPPRAKRYKLGRKRRRSSRRARKLESSRPDVLRARISASRAGFTWWGRNGMDEWIAWI